MAYKQFTPDVLSSADVNTYLMRQAVVTFADATERTNTLGTSIPEGMVTYLRDTNVLETYNGSAWVGLTTSNLIVGPTSDSQGMGIRPYTVAGISGAAYGLYMGSQVLDNYGNGYVVWSNGSQTYVRGNNITMYAGDDVNDSAWVEMQSNRVRIAANYNVGFDMDANGRIKMPYQPAFQAYGTVASAAHGTFPVRLLNTYFNRGNVYNPATGYFTAPMAGVYSFTWSFLSGNANDVYRWYLRKNGSLIGDLHIRGDTSATGSEYITTTSRTWLISLVQGDTIAISYVSDSGANAFYNGGGNEYSAFGGHLIG